MERITVKDLERKLELFAQVSGQKIAKSYNDIGGLQFNWDYNQPQIHRITNKGGGVDCPYGHHRGTKREVFEMLCGMVEMSYDMKNRPEYYKGGK